MVVSEIGLNDLSLIWDTRYRQSRPPWKFCISDNSCLDERKEKKRKTINHAMPYEVDLPPGIFLRDEICEDSSAVFDRGSSRYSSN